MSKLVLCASVSVILTSTAAHAQSASAADTPVAQIPVPEIIVTAERRSGTVQKTPATISVLSGADLSSRGVTSLDDALNTVPGVYLQTNNKGTNINIRGVGTSLDGAAGDPGVNTSVDGVYLRQASTITSGLYDLARIEVLKGPQGTLYGRNATGGVVNVLTNDPVHDFGYNASATVGNYNLLNTEAAMNVPVTDTLAVRAAFGSERHSGYLSSGQDDADRIGGRAKVLWEPTSSVRILAGLSYSHDGGTGPGSVYVTEPEGSRQAAPFTHEPAGKLDQKFVTAFANAEWDLGPVKLTIIPTYSHYNYNYVGTNFGFYSEQRANENQGTVEFRVSSGRGSPIEWVAGLYYYDDNLSNYSNLPDSGIVNDQPRLGTKSYAAFADATVPITDRLRLGGGIRYTKDDRTQYDTVVTGGGETFGPFDGKLSFDAVNYRVGAQFDLGPGTMLYVTHSTGYKAGGFYPDEPGSNTYKPEKLTAVEGGIKSRFLNNKLTLNLSGFYYSYQDYQVSDLGLAAYGGLSALVFNAQGKTKIYGAEAQLNYRPTNIDSIDLTLSPLKGNFGQFVIAATPVSAPVDVSGLSIPSAPGLSGTGAYQHVWSVLSGKLTTRAQTYFSTGYWSEFTHSYKSHRGGYTRTDLNVTYSGPSDRWSIGAFVRNVENSWIVSQKANTAIGDYGLQPPRTFGVVLSLRN